MMKDKLDLSYLTIKPSKQEQEELAKAIIYVDAPLRYKRLKSGKYKVSCSHCGETYSVSEQEFKMIHASRICSHCHNDIHKFSTLDTEYLHDYITKGNNGFYVVIKDKLGCKPKMIMCDHVLAYNDGKLYRRNVVRNMYSLNRVDSKGWKQIKGYTDYTSYFYKLERIQERMKDNPAKTKKELYESYFLDNLKLKDNQKKMVIDNLYNRNQIKAIKLFNLKKAQDLYKYRAYITKNAQFIWALDVESIELNEYYLHYLWKNKISLSDFFDYIEQCEKLNVKLDKPKDFQARHDAYSHRIAWSKNEKENQKIKRKYKIYQKYLYKSKDIEIKPFKNVKEIIDCGEKLHNCIGSYVGRYASGNTMIFYLTEKRRLKAAIEVKNGKLIQARIKSNKDCNRKQKYHIKKWLEKNGWKYA